MSYLFFFFLKKYITCVTILVNDNTSNNLVNKNLSLIIIFVSIFTNLSFLENNHKFVNCKYINYHTCHIYPFFKKDFICVIILIKTMTRVPIWWIRFVLHVMVTLCVSNFINKIHVSVDMTAIKLCILCSFFFFSLKHNTNDKR